MEPNERRIEQWLDAALKQYGATDPRPGLEGRILARLRAEKAHLPSYRRWWALAAAMATATVIIGVWLASSTSHRTRDQVGVATAVSRDHESKPQAEAVTLPQVTEAVKGTGVRRPRRANARSIAVSQAQRVEQFPAPRPLSDQDRLLLAYVRQAPKEEVASVITQIKSGADLQIEDLHIPPLDSETPASESNQRN